MVGLLLIFIVQNMQPLRLCNDESFRNLFYALDPKFVPPNRKTLSDYLRDNYLNLFFLYQKIYFKLVILNS